MKEEFIYNDFNYKRGETDEFVSIFHNEIKPKNIFKFYALNKYSVDALLNGYFYASHPYDLNDVLDSNTLLLFTERQLDYERYKSLYGNLKMFIDNESELISFYNKDINRSNICGEYISNIWDTLSNKFGLISTTTVEDNNLMWPHYTQEKGFQIKFDTEELEKSIKEIIKNDNTDSEYLGFYPVNYSNELNPIDISQFENMFIPLAYLTNVKLNVWDYEKEWRFLVSKENMGVPNSKTGRFHIPDYFVDKENRYIYYDKKLIQQITLGMNFFNAKEYNIVPKNNTTIIVDAKQKIDGSENWNYQCQNDFLNYLADNFKDRIYFSAIRFAYDKENKAYLKRTKERFDIEKMDENKFSIKRTNEII